MKKEEGVSEMKSSRSFGIRNLKYVNKIKQVLENECPNTVSCADIMALAARDAIVLVLFIYLFI